MSLLGFISRLRRASGESACLGAVDVRISILIVNLFCGKYFIRLSAVLYRMETIFDSFIWPLLFSIAL